MERDSLLEHNYWSNYIICQSHSSNFRLQLKCTEEYYENDKHSVLKPNQIHRPDCTATGLDKRSTGLSVIIIHLRDVCSCHPRRIGNETPLQIHSLHLITHFSEYPHGLNSRSLLRGSRHRMRVVSNWLLFSWRFLLLLLSQLATPVGGFTLPKRPPKSTLRGLFGLKGNWHASRTKGKIWKFTIVVITRARVN